MISACRFVRQNPQMHRAYRKSPTAHESPRPAHAPQARACRSALRMNSFHNQARRCRRTTPPHARLAGNMPQAGLVCNGICPPPFAKIPGTFLPQRRSWPPWTFSKVKPCPISARRSPYPRECTKSMLCVHFHAHIQKIPCCTTTVGSCHLANGYDNATRPPAIKPS